MKRKSLVAILLALAVCLTMALTACKDDDDTGGGGLPPTLEQTTRKVQEMPTSTDGSAIENAIGDVFGVDIDLPEGTLSAQPFSYDGVSAYMVTVSGANTTAQDYYNSIKEEMIAEGYTAEDSELAFYKIVGIVVYSVTVENDGDDIIVVSGANSVASMQGNPSNPSNPINPSNLINPANPINPSTPAASRTAWLTADEMASLHIGNIPQPAGAIVEVIGDSFDGFGLSSVWFEFSLTDVTVEEFEAYCQMLYNTIGVTKGYGGEETEFNIGENMGGVMKIFEGYYLYNDDGFKGEIYAYHYSESGESYGVTWEQNTMSIRITYANY